MDSDLNLVEEVNFIKQDIKFAVQHFDLSEKFPENDGRIYINIKTKEEDKFCVELSKEGFKVVGDDFDCLKEEEGGHSQLHKTYETVYALLSNISASYYNTFSNELARKLSSLSESSTQKQDASLETN